MPVTVIPAESANASPVTAAPYTIGKTKKGGLPVRVESRSKGKKVTMVFNVTLFVFFLICLIGNKNPKKSDCEMSWLV